MIQLSNLTSQTLQPGQALRLDGVTLRTKNSRECHNMQSPTTVKLCSTGIYDISYSGNIAGAAGEPIQLALALGGEPLIDTAMNSVSTAEGDLHNIHTEKLVRNCCCDLDRLSIINTGTNAVTVAQNSVLIIKKYS